MIASSLRVRSVCSLVHFQNLEHGLAQSGRSINICRMKETQKRACEVLLYRTLHPGGKVTVHQQGLTHKLCKFYTATKMRKLLMSNFVNAPKTSCYGVRAKCTTVVTVCEDLYKKRTKYAMLELFRKGQRKLRRPVLWRLHGQGEGSFSLWTFLHF